MLRLEVWFKNGLFRAFPDVRKDEFIHDETHIAFAFGKDGHEAFINLKEVNFIERIDE